MWYGCCNPVGAAEAVTFYQLTTDRHLLGLNLSGWIQSNPHPQCQDVINSRYWCTAPLASKITSAGRGVGGGWYSHQWTYGYSGLGTNNRKDQRGVCLCPVSCALTAEEKSLCSTSDFLILFPLLEKFHRHHGVTAQPYLQNMSSLPFEDYQQHCYQGVVTSKLLR